MSTLQALLSVNYWRYTLFETLKIMVGAFGIPWSVVEITSYFSDKAGQWIKAHVWWFVFVALFLAAWERRPVVSVKERLVGRDVELEIRIGDLFNLNGAYIIGSNTTFDTDITCGLISRKSLQGHFTSKFYENHKELDRDLKEVLGDVDFETLPEGRQGKRKRYPIGTIAKLRVKSRTIYLVAIAHMNEHGSAYSTFENLKESLPKLWDYIGERGGMEPLVVPLLGSGFSRITVPRDELAREIVKSFVAACATKKFCERFTLVISPKDYRTHNLNLYELGEFLRYECQYTEYKSKGDVGTGQALSM